MEVINYKAPLFFNELNRIKENEFKAENTRMPSLVNTYQNIPLFQQSENLSRNYARTGQQRFEDPFAYKQRMLDNSYDGRKLDVLNTLKYNATKDSPDIYTTYPLKVSGFY
jgi:hypothetical protein